MYEISLSYWNDLARHTILISALMSGFSIAVVVNLLIYESSNRFTIYTLKAATTSAGCFLVSVFAWTDILMLTNQGYPFPFDESDLILPRIIGGLAFMFGIVALSLVIALSGWIKSKSTGIFTTAIGLVTFILIVLMMLS